MRKSRLVTYSPAFTLVPTYECFNRCSYCNFRVDPGQDGWISLAEARQLLAPLRSQGVIEVLILSGEVHPQSPRRQDWFQHIYNLGQLALDLGFLPHTNVGPLSYEEMAQLKQVNVSMGLMLEQLTPTLLGTVHRHAPSKDPGLRLQQLQWAGKLKIPFTTGLLLGLGETVADWRDSLDAIAVLHTQWGHIQEVILQPHQPGQTQTETAPPFSPQQLRQVIQIARQHLPPDITLQIPPNLLPNAQEIAHCLAAGARDLGGLSPKDEVNPDYPHPTIQGLSQELAPYRWQLQPRLPIYPQYIDWLSPALQHQVAQVALPRTGLIGR